MSFNGKLSKTILFDIYMHISLRQKPHCERHSIGKKRIIGINEIGKLDSSSAISTRAAIEKSKYNLAQRDSLDSPAVPIREKRAADIYWQYKKIDLFYFCEVALCRFTGKHYIISGDH